MSNQPYKPTTGTDAPRRPDRIKDVSDFFAAGGTPAQLMALVEAAPIYMPPAEAPPTGPGVRIEIGPDEYRVVGEALAALASEPDIFCRGGLLVRTIRADPSGLGRAQGPLTIAPLPGANLRERLTARCELLKLKTGEWIQAHPPPWLVEALLARGEWPGLRPLAGVSDIPVLRRDGSLHATPGYDAITCTVYAPRGRRPDVPTNPSRADAVAAMQRVLDPVCDFGFETPEHRAAWLATLLTAVGRTAFDGPAPATLIDSNVRGSGKGLLAQIVGIVATGSDLSPYTYTNDSEELRKKITAVAIAGDRVVFLDNIDGDFGNDSLDRALTATRWRDRILGRSELVDLPLLATWIGTGNNVAVAADTCRRLIHVRLDVLYEHPEDRTDFRYPDLLGHVREYRVALAGDALTILGAFIQGGERIVGLTGLGSFEGWSRTIREAIIWVGLPDPAKTRIALTEKADTTKETLRMLIAAFKAYAGAEAVAIGPMMDELYGQHPPRADPAAEAMRGALVMLTGTPAGRPPSAHVVGKRLAKYCRRVIDREYLDRGGRSRLGQTWRVVPTNREPGDEG